MFKSNYNICTKITDCLRINIDKIKKTLFMVKWKEQMKWIWKG